MADRPVSPSDAHFDDEAVAESDAPETDVQSDDGSDAGAAATASEAAGPDPAEFDRLQDRLLRLTAEYDNYRRRSVGDREEAVRQGRRGVLVPMLDVYDDLTRSLDAAQRAAQQDSGSPSFDALSQGIELVYQKFSDALERVGVTPIEAVGKPFDEDEHEAMMQQPAPDGTESGTVLAEIQPGYRLGDRVLRHARVIVAE
jgi:molecular chaperone GrpE